jgi:hypothetical protein
MATVAALALAAPAAAEEQAQTDDQANQQLEQAQQTLDSAAGGEQAEGAGEAQMPAATAEGQPTEEPATAAEQAPITAEEEPATAAEQAPMTAEEEPVEPAEAEMAEDQEAVPPPDMSFIEVQEDAQFLAEQEVIGKDVVNIMDEEVGTIADLVMDQEQKLVGVVLSVGGFLGLGAKSVAIPVDQIEFPAPDQPARLLVAVTEEQLKNAPDFTTRETVEAQEAAEQAQTQMQQQQMQTPPPAATAQ